MRITELNISEFGCLKGVRINPDDRMNIIYGENESGKSTVLLFIKFMLYGLGRRSASNSERERSISWSGHTAAGSMTFSHGGKNYRIERRFNEVGRSGSEKLTVVCLDDGSEISTEKTPGEYFLGVPKEVFESSACVGQMRSAEINGEKTADTIRNMLTSADETVDTAKILKSLDAVRVGYLHKNKQGGSLWEDKQNIDRQRQRLESASEANLSLEEWEKKLENARRDLGLVKDDLDSKDRLISEINKINIIKRFEKNRADIARRDEISSAKQSYAAENLLTDYFPDRSHTAELKLSARDLAAAKERLDEKKTVLSEPGELGYDPQIAALGEQIEKNGGADAILTSVNAKIGKKKKQNGAIISVWATQAVLAAVGAGLMLMGFPFGAAFFAFVAIAVIITVKAAGTKKRLSAEISAVCEAYGCSCEELEQRLKKCLGELAAYRARIAENARLETEVSEAQKAFDRSETALDTLLRKTLPSTKVTYEAAVAEQARLEAFLTRYDELSREEETISRIVESEARSLQNYDEDELRGGITATLDDITPAAIAEAEKMRSFLSSKKNALEQKVAMLNDTVIRLKTTAEDPLPIADKLAELEAKYSSDFEFYSALEMAMEALEKAGEVMQGSVTPVIASQAGEIMGRISGDKYTCMRTTNALGLSLDSDGFGVKSDLLSAGTRDAAYLALRIALFMRIFGDKTPPLVLDEALCQFDDVRAERMLSMLGGLCGDGVQCLLFTSHKREMEICEREGIGYKLIQL